MNYAPTVLPILRDLRSYILGGWGKAQAVNQKTDSAWSIVTEVDIEVEKRTASALSAAYPNVEFVGEEAGGDRMAKKFWLMDPIDGTLHYARGMPFCTSMLALVDKGEPVFSVIYDFLNDRMYYAEKGQGAFCNGERIKVSTRSLNEALISFETNVAVTGNKALHDRLSSSTDVVKSYSAGFEFAMVASGKLEGRICLDPYGSDYDFVPGCLLVREAGGIVSNVGSTTYDYRNLNFIAANPVVYKELTAGEGAIFPFV